MGDANRVRGTLRAPRRDARPTSRSAPLDAAAAAPRPARRRGRAVAIRPEAIALRPAGAAPLRGRVRKAAYLGGVMEYTLDTAIGALFVISTAVDRAARRRRRVGVALAHHGVIAIPARLTGAGRSARGERSAGTAHHALALAHCVLVAASSAAGTGGRASATCRAPPGIVAAAEPVAAQPRSAAARSTARGHTFVARARYDITARVLRKEIYRVDGGAEPRAGGPRRRLGPDVRHARRRPARVLADGPILLLAADGRQRRFRSRSTCWSRTRRRCTSFRRPKALRAPAEEAAARAARHASAATWSTSADAERLRWNTSLTPHRYRRRRVRDRVGRSR